MKYFSVKELTRSMTAKVAGLSNEPSAEHCQHLEEMVDNLIDPLREAWGSAITVTSGYRGYELNIAVGGVPTSAHSVGYAVDLVPVNGKLKEFKSFCRKFIENRNFDQLISENENPDGVPEWIHVGYKTRSGLQRRQLLSKKKIGGYVPMTD